MCVCVYINIQAELVSFSHASGKECHISFTEEEGDEIKIGTSCKNGGCTKVCSQTVQLCTIFI